MRIMYKWYGSEYARHRRKSTYQPKRGVHVAKIGTTRWPSYRSNDQIIRVLDGLIGKNVRIFQEVHHTRMIDVTNYGDATCQSFPGHGENIWKIHYHLSGDGVMEYYNLCCNRSPYHQIRANGVYIAIGEWEWEIRASGRWATKVEALVRMTIHMNFYNLRYFPVRALANLIDPRIPYVVRRLTYKRRKGWTFPHEPYCNVIRQRRLDAWCDDMEEADRRDYYSDYDEGDYDDE